MPETENGPPAQAQPQPDLTGRTFGDFQVLRKLGAGGMGQVYLARQLSLRREVALKFLRNDLTTNVTALKRFEAEAQAVARLTHPGIVQVYQFGEADGLRFMVLEFVDGRNLRDYLARRGTPDLPVVFSVIRQVAAALQKAHEHGIVHRDIKPENILVTRKVEVKVTDFGLSRFFAEGESLNITQSGVTVGTPLYVSPEQAQGQAVDHRSDIYSFGISCYHLLAGEPPFTGTTAVEVALKHITEQPRPLMEKRPDLPADLCGMVHKMMAKAPADRYQSARDILRDLAKIREGMNLGLTQAVLTASNGSVPALASNSSTSGLVALSHSQSGYSPQPMRWARWVAAGLVCLFAGLAGVVAYAMTNPPKEAAQPSANPTPPSPGLPDVRPSEKITTARERELLAQLRDRDTSPDKIIEGYIELALMYIRDRRLPEARQAFEKLADQKFTTGVLHNHSADRAGKLGVAVVLAHQDKADDSVKQFNVALSAPLPKLPGKADPVRTPLYAAQMVLLQHSDLAEAVSVALNRDVANGVKLTGQLEALRSPRGVTPKQD
jgi:serine/threonine-protein kinase